MKRWYVIQVYAGYEETIKVDLKKTIEGLGVEQDFGQILIPSAQVKQMFDVEDAKSQQLFPGYMLIEMEMKPETNRLVTSRMRVIKFLGGEVPMPLSKKEVARVVSQVKGEIPVEAKREDFVAGSEVEIQDGPFAGFIGIIDKVNQESEKLSVMVSIFGRMTSVELGFNQVKR